MIQVCNCSFSVFADQFPPRDFTDEPDEGTPFREGDLKPKPIICKTSSIPTANYRWLKDGVYVSNFSRSYSYRLQNVNRSDAGVYRCEASNELGSILSSGANLQVACK